MPTNYIVTTYLGALPFASMTAGDSLTIAPVGGIIAPNANITAVAGATGLNVHIGGDLEVAQLALRGLDHIAITATGSLYSTAAAAPAVTLGSFGSSYLSNQGVIINLNDTAVFATGGHNVITNSGHIEGFAGLELGFGLASGDTLLNTGSVIGHDVAVFVEGGGTSIQNEGLINGIASDAIQITGDFNGENAFPVDDRIFNSGTISSQSGIAIRDQLVAPLSHLFITNTGLISSGLNTVIDSTGLSIETVVNTGQIVGLVSLGENDDTYDGRGGELLGGLRMGVGKDIIDLRGGSVSGPVEGGDGNDTYFIDTAAVTLVETAVASDVDTVNSAATYRLVTNFENLNLLEAGNFNGIGNELGNVIQGNSGDNRLNGLDGNDTMNGNVGNDRVIGGTFNDSIGGDDGDDTLLGNVGNDNLKGNDGDDSIIGGLGKDAMAGGTGADVFVFSGLAHSANTAVNADVIADFIQGDDLISLVVIDANTNNAVANDAFAFIGAAAFSGVAGQLHAVQSLGNTFVEMDVNGDSVADSVIRLNGLFILNAADFVL